jgi:cytochrome c biogenesis protein CcmG/thiol:disulfide interchange protein DsbE
MKRSSTGLLLSLCLLLVTSGCIDEAGGDREGPNDIAPDFDLPLLNNGNQIRLEDLHGKIVILDFWATWCAPCEVQMPVLDTLWQDEEERAEHGDDLMIIGVSVDTDPPNKVSNWIAERGFLYPIAIGDQDLAMRYGVIGFPTLVVIDPSGGIHTRHTGVWSRPEIESVLDQIRLDMLASR